MIAHKTSDFLLTNPQTIDKDITPTSVHDDTEAVRPYWIYALRLAGGKYYVGYTAKKNPYDRIVEHGTYQGAKWTRKYRPLGVLEVRDLGVVSRPMAEAYTMRLTWEYMQLYGRQNVRGSNLSTLSHIFIMGNRAWTSSDFKELSLGLLLIALSSMTLYYWFTSNFN